MTHSKPLGSKLISLLLAFAMILALMPAVSLTASAAGANYTLTSDKAQYADGWTWDGETLNFYGSETYDCTNIYFDIQSANNNTAKVVISGSLTVNLPKTATPFIYAECALDISGAGKVTASASNSTALFYAPDQTVTYAGGAICSDSALMLFYCDKLTMNKGSIEAPNGSIRTHYRCSFNDSNVILRNVGVTANNCTISVGVNKSYLSVGMLDANASNCKSYYTIMNSVVVSSGDEKAALTDGTANGNLVNFDSLYASVLRLTNTDMTGVTPASTILATDKDVNKAVDGGWVYCDQLLTDKIQDVKGQGILDLGTTTKISGAYMRFSDSLTKGGGLKNASISGGVLIDCPKGELNFWKNVNAKNATIVFSERLGNDYIISLCSSTTINTFDSCTIVSRNNENVSGTKLQFIGPDASAKLSSSYVYANKGSGIRYPSSPNTPEQVNSYYAASGYVQMGEKIAGASRYADITAGEIKASLTGRMPVLYGNVCADVYNTSSAVTFDGADEYAVSIKKVSSTLNINNAPTYAHAFEKQSDGKWTYLRISGSYSGSGKSLYIGEPPINSVADPDAEYDDVTVYKDYPAVINVPLAQAYDKGLLDVVPTLLDNAGTHQKINPESVGVTIETRDGGNNSLDFVISAPNIDKDASYMIELAVNGTLLKSSTTSNSTIPVYLKTTPDFTMKFSDDADVRWPYRDASGEIRYFTPDSYNSTFEAADWTWDGTTKTLTLKNGGSFTTTADNGIEIKDNAFIDVNSNWNISANKYAFLSTGSLSFEGSQSKQYKLTLNSGIKSESNVVIKYFDIDVLPEADYSNTLLAANILTLDNCAIYANDSFKGEYSIYVNKHSTIRRGVSVNTPASSICLGSQNNIRLAEGEIENLKEYYSAGFYFKPIDTSERVDFFTKQFEVDSTNAVICEESMTTSQFIDGVEYFNYSVLGGKTYKLDLSQFISVQCGDCDFTLDSAAGSQYQLVRDSDDGKMYLVADFSNTAQNTDIIKINVADTLKDYGSNETKTLSVTIGKVVPTDKLGFTREGDYTVNSNECYTVSAEYNGQPLEMQGDFPDEYYSVPSGEEVNITLLPTEGYKFEFVQLVSWDSSDGAEVIGPSESGTYSIKTDGDKKLYIRINPTSEPQYCTVDISDDLRKSVTDGDIAITLTYPDGTVKTLNGKLDQFPAYALNGTEVTVSTTTQTKSVLSINGIAPDYDSDTGVYSAKLAISENTTITAQLENLADLCSFEVKAVNLYYTDNKITVTPDPLNALGQYKIGTEVEIFANVTDDKFIGEAKFNGAAVEPYKQGDGGYYYKVTTVAGSNILAITYTDLSTLTIAKPEHGSVEFSGRLDYGRSSETLADGTQVYSIGTGDTVTLTITPDKGYRLKSVKLDGNKAVEVTAENGVCTFMMDQFVNWTFTAEFEEIPEGNAVVTVKCGENGTVSPSTSDYPIGTKVTLTVTPDSGYEVKSAALDGKTVKLTGGKYTFTLTADCVFSVEFQKKSSGGNTGGNTSGGHYSGGSGTVTKESKPSINGESKSWSDIASDISKSGENDTIIIDTNGETNLPADVIKAIKDSGATLTVKIDASKSWTIDGSDIKDGASSADLSLLPGTSTAKGARGTAGYRFTTGGNDVDADLTIQFKPEYAGKFANLYFIKDGKAEFVSTAKVAENGSATFADVTAKGEYVVMLSDYSDLPGDVNNDGKVLISDALAALYCCTDIEQAANPEMLDFNGDGQVTIADALAILRYSVGLSY